MSSARRVVFDTGVLVSAAILPESTPALALEKAWLYFEPCVSMATLAELETVLLRPKFDRYSPAASRQAFVAGVREHARLVLVEQEVSDCPDPADNKFLALADAAGAELIISSDPHLTDMHPWRGIPIMPPAAFLVAIR
jgi:putative PIN family toxin of toxin-antitoxin system